MKTNKTEEKKCEQVCRGIHILHGEHCQKEQPEQEVHDKLMNMALDHAKSAAHPPVLPSPPQELRQEAVINPFVGNIAELHKAIELLETMIPSDERKNLAKMYYTTATEMIEANRIQAYMEKIRQLENMLDDASDEIKNVEQKAREEERKRCAEIIKYERDTCLEHRQENEYLEWTSTMNHAENKILNKPTP